MPMRIDWPLRGHGYTEEEIAAVTKVMRAVGTAITQGPNVLRFEKAFAEYVNTETTFALMSGAHALDIAAMQCAINPGEEVIVPAHTYCASAISFARRGAVVRWGDLNPASLSLSVESPPVGAAAKVDEVFADPLVWWLTPRVQRAKDQFTHRFARTSETWRAEWVRELSTQTARAQPRAIRSPLGP